MKKKSLFTLLIIVILSCAVLIINFADEQGLIKAFFSTLYFPETFSENETPLSVKNYEILNDKEKKAYINIFNKIKEHPEYIRIPSLTNKEFNNVFFAVKNDNPDILCFSDSCNMVSFLNASFIQLNYVHDFDKCNKMMSDLNQLTDKIISEMNVDTDFEKELYIHDYIVRNCSYEESTNASSAYGCLIDNKAICSGYSRAAMILLKKAGIECMVISGTGITSENEKISHMWNIVWLNNEAYHLDVTWDDPVSESEDFISHLFFNLTDKQITYDHTDLSLNIQSFKSNYNYFEKNGLLFFNFDKSIANTIAEKLCENIKYGINFIEIRFFDDKSYSSAVEKLINNKSFSDELYIIISYLDENVGELVDVSHVSFSKDDNRHYIRIMFDKI